MALPLRRISSGLAWHLKSNQIVIGAGPAPSKGAFGLKALHELLQSPG